MEAGRGDEPTIYNGKGGAGTRTLQSIKRSCLADSSSRWKGSCGRDLSDSGYSGHEMGRIS